MSQGLQRWMRRQSDSNIRLWKQSLERAAASWYAPVNHSCSVWVQEERTRTVHIHFPPTQSTTSVRCKPHGLQRRAVPSLPRSHSTLLWLHPGSKGNLSATEPAGRLSGPRGAGGPFASHLASSPVLSSITQSLHSLLSLPPSL